MKLYKKNLNKLIEGNVYNPINEHDSCGVGFVASTEGVRSRKVVEYGIQALKAVWHRGAVDADGNVFVAEGPASRPFAGGGLTKYVVAN